MKFDPFLNYFFSEQENNKEKRERENEEKKCRPSVKIYRTIICEKKKGIVTSKTYLYHSSNC